MYVLMSIMSTYCRHTSHEHRAVRADHVHQLGFMPRWGSPGAAAPLLPPAGYPGSTAASADATPVGASGSCGTASAAPSCWQRALMSIAVNGSVCRARPLCARRAVRRRLLTLYWSTGWCGWRGYCGWSREWLAWARVLHQSATNVCAFAYVRRIRMVYTKVLSFQKAVYLLYKRSASTPDKCFGKCPLAK